MEMSDVQMQLVRLKHANERVLVISNQIQKWSKDNLDSKIVIAKDRRSWHLELIVKNDPPYNEWSMHFSDCVGQLRNTLDNLVFSVLTPLANKRDLPNSKLIKFPIALNAKQWKNTSKGIKHIPEPYYSRIKEVQPFSRTNQQSSGLLDGLEVLQKLSNSDKHNLQLVPLINIADFQHNFSVEYETDYDARISTPPSVEISKPVFRNGYCLVRHKGKGKIKSVQGDFKIESQVIVNINGSDVGITQILTDLWKYVAQIIIKVADLPDKEFKDWAESL